MHFRNRAPPLPGPLTPILQVYRFLPLLAQLGRREVAGRYRGSILGLLWTFLTPALMLAVYTFVFGVVFEARWERPIENRGEFALILFLGLILYWLFSECLGHAAAVLQMNANFVKKVVFPLEILPCVPMWTALLHTGVRLVVFVVAYLLVLGSPPLTILWLPLVLLPLVALTLGFSWFLAWVGAFVRDVNEFVSVALTAALFLSPVFYPSSLLPGELRWLLLANPISFPVEQARNVVFWGEAPDWAGLGLYGAVAWALAWLGFALFKRAQRGFADVV